MTRYVGIDITDVLFPRLRREFPSFEFHKRDVTSDDLEGVFDLVLMIDVVEHIVEAAKLDTAIRNVQRCLMPGGTAILAFPSTGYWPRRLFYVRWWTKCEITERLAGYGTGGSHVFRDGHIMAFRKPRGEICSQGSAT